MKDTTKTQVMNAAADLFETLYGGDISADTRKKLYTSIIDILDPLIEEAYEEDEKPKSRADYSVNTLTTSITFNTYVAASDFIDRLNKYVKSTGSISIAKIFLIYNEVCKGVHLLTTTSDYEYGFTEPGFVHLTSRDVYNDKILITFDLDLIKRLS